MNRSARERQMSITNATARSAEMRRIQGRLGEVDQELQRLHSAVAERNTELVRAASETMRGILRQELQRLEGQIAERGAERQDILQQIGVLRQEISDLNGRVGSVENRVTGVVARVDGLEVNSQAHATAISRLEAANGWVPIIGALIATFVTYFFIEGVEWLREDRFTTQNQWFWAVLVGALVGLLLTVLSGNSRSVFTRSGASASASTTTGHNDPAPQPPADQPAPAAAVAPPPPPSGNQFPSVQAASAAHASAGS